MADDKNKKKKQSHLKWYDYIAIPIGAVLIILFCLFSAEIIFKEHANNLSIFLFNILSLIFVSYISIRVAYLVYKSEFIENQKKLAKTSIRHLRATNGELRGVERLIDTRKKKIKGELHIHIFEEIANQLRNISHRIQLSENDFKEIVNEEFEEENSIVSKIIPMINDLSDKYQELKELQEKRTADKEEKLKEKINELRREIQEIKVEINKDIRGLPFGASYASAAGESPDYFSLVEPYPASESSSISLAHPPIILPGEIIDDSAGKESK